MTKRHRTPDAGSKQRASSLYLQLLDVVSKHLRAEFEANEVLDEVLARTSPFDADGEVRGSCVADAVGDDDEITDEQIRKDVFALLDAIARAIDERDTDDVHRAALALRRDASRRAWVRHCDRFLRGLTDHTVGDRLSRSTSPDGSDKPIAKFFADALEAVDDVYETHEPDDDEWLANESHRLIDQLVAVDERASGLTVDDVTSALVEFQKADKKTKRGEWYKQRTRSAGFAGRLAERCDAFECTRVSDPAAAFRRYVRPLDE